MGNVPSVVEFEQQFDSHLDCLPAIINPALALDCGIMSAQSHDQQSASIERKHGRFTQAILGRSGRLTPQPGDN
jgi:hypothetical protein